jgi:hypothetical protein
VPVVQRGEPPSSREPDRADTGADKKQSSRDRIKVNALFCIFGPTLDIARFSLTWICINFLRV